VFLGIKTSNVIADSQPGLIFCQFGKIMRHLLQFHATHDTLTHMDKGDLKEIKNIIDSALETHLASVHEEIADLRRDLRGEIKEVEDRLTTNVNRVNDNLGAKVDHVDEKLGNFENREVDKWLQLEVRVTNLESEMTRK
jgi:hypothetical protein